MVWWLRGVGLAGGRVRGRRKRGGVPALGNGSKPAGLVGPGGSWEQSCRSCQTSFCRGRTSSLSWLSDSLPGARRCLCSSLSSTFEFTGVPSEWDRSGSGNVVSLVIGYLGFAQLLRLDLPDQPGIGGWQDLACSMDVCVV